MKNKEENTIIHKVFQTLEKINTGSIKDIAIACNMSELQVTTAVDTLLKLNKAYIREWNFTETSRCPVRVIKLGRGVNASRERKSDIVNRNSINLDLKLKMIEHKKWLETFKPHPDVAAAWLFK
jgi:hypothetical protein